MYCCVAFIFLITKFHCFKNDENKLFINFILNAFLLKFILKYFNRYHNGWLTLQRRQVNNVARREGDQQDRPVEENIAENNQNRENLTVNQANPSLFRLISTFVFTFFTSLIPERPRA